MPKAIVVAVDGPAGSGKGTLCQLLASRLNLAHLDTGLLYRACAAQAIAAGTDLGDAEACTAIAVQFTADWTAKDGLRSEKIGQAASKISVIPGVRKALTDFQTGFAENPPGNVEGSVLDGRDIGTVICPQADVKLFLEASIDVRAQRRLEHSLAVGIVEDFESVRKSIAERDDRERTRTSSPMLPADDALILDTSEMNKEEVLSWALEHIARARPELFESFLSKHR